MVKDDRQVPVVRVHRHLLVGLAQIKALPNPGLPGGVTATSCQSFSYAESHASYVVDVLELQVGRHGVRLVQLSLQTIINWS